MQVPTGLGTRRRANSPQHHSRRRDDRQARAGCRQSHRPILGRVMNRKNSGVIFRAAPSRSQRKLKSVAEKFLRATREKAPREANIGMP
jgi:hypothetical protein